MIEVVGVITSIEQVWEYNIEYVIGTVSVMRRSGVSDNLKFKIKGLVDDISVDPIGQYVSINGYIRTYTDADSVKKTQTVIYIKDPDGIKFIGEAEYNEKRGTNKFFQDVTIDQIGEIRETPKGRTILDVSLVLRRSNGYIDHLNAILWGNTAKSFKDLYKVGNRIFVSGRLQSRDYNKMVDGVTYVCTNIELVINDFSDMCV